MINHLKSAIPGIEADIERTVNLQCLDENDFYYGIVTDVAKGYTEPDVGIKTAAKLVSAYYNKHTKWYKNPLLLERAILAAKHTNKRLNDDGTMDLMETNFHDPTMNGFSVHVIGPVYKLLLRETEHTALEDEVSACIEEFMRRSGDAMVNGGFHTPNHRWVISAALSYCYNTLGDEKYLNHIKKFLENEGIDCDENGEFTERSAAGYTILCQRLLIMMAEELNMPELLDHVARSLRMSMTFMEPDNSLNTLNSTRQDFGKSPNFNGYYEPYLKMAILTGDGEFAWMANKILANGGSCDMTWFLLFPEHEEKQLSIEPKAPASLDYEKLYEESGIMRQRIGDATLTLIKGRPLFAKLHYKNKPMLLRFTGSFFAQGQFSAQTLEKTADGYRLNYRRQCGYVGPYNEKQKSNLWKDMDYGKRPKLGTQTYDVTFDFKLTDGELKIDLDACTVDGSCDNVPVKLELMFPAGCVYENDSTMLVTRNGDYVFQKETPATLLYNDHIKFTVEGGFCEHYYAKNMRGSVGADGQALTVCFTGFTPQKRTIKVKYSNG